MVERCCRVRACRGYARDGRSRAARAVVRIVAVIAGGIGGAGGMSSVAVDGGMRLRGRSIARRRVGSIRQRP